LEKVEFVRCCGELLNAAKPHLKKCELRKGKDMPENLLEHYMEDEDYVLITCVNAHNYAIPVEGISLSAIAAEIFSRMVHK